METNWKIANLKRKPEDGLVIEVTWIMNFDLNGEKDRKVGMTKLEGDSNDPNFVAYEDLTEEIVLDWIKSELGEEKIENIENEFKTILENRIQKKENPEFLTGKPWGNSTFNF
jgi:hypothetical protein